MTDVLILCGGKGTRLKGVIGEAPKVLAPVAGRPFLDYLLGYIKSHRFRRMILCSGYGADAVEQYCRGLDDGCEYLFSREREPLGTGGAVKLAAGLVQSDPVIVLNGDSLCAVDLTGLEAFHHRNKAVATLAVTAVSDCHDCGTVKLDPESRIVEFNEKAGRHQAGTVNVGFYCFSKQIFQMMPASKVFSLEYDVFPSLIGKGLFGFKIKEELTDIGTPERLSTANRRFAK